MNSRRLRNTGLLLLLGCGFAAAAYSGDQPQTPLRVLPPGELGKVIRLGETLVNETSTHPLTKAFVGNVLNCTSCHLEAGTHPAAASFIGVATAYPAWSPREQKVISLEDRIGNCFLRSMNGTRLPSGHEASVAIAAYITWLSQGERLKMNPEAPLGPRHVPKLKLDVTTADLKRGEQLYRQKCADCHGRDGQGVDDSPPVWGAKSYNSGAGLSRPASLANWLKVAMPIDDPNLSAAEALDIAAYVNSHPRPQFQQQP